MVADPQGAVFSLFKWSQPGSPEPVAQGTPGHVGWHELTTDEKANLERALFLVNGVTPLKFEDVDVIECRDPQILGLYSNGRVQVVQRILSDRNVTLETLVHEAAHKLGGGDGEHTHVAHIEKLWSGIVARLTDKAT